MYNLCLEIKCPSWSPTSPYAPAGSDNLLLDYSLNDVGSLNKQKWLWTEPEREPNLLYVGPRFEPYKTSPGPI